MNRNLPKVYASPINKPITNNKDIFISSKDSTRSLNSNNIPEKINEIFANPHHVYKSDVKIITNNDSYTTTIVGLNGSNLLTLNGERININNILDIERI